MLYNHLHQQIVSNNVNDNSDFQLQWQNVIPFKYCNNKLLLRMRFSSSISALYVDAYIISVNFGNICF